MRKTTLALAAAGLVALSGCGSNDPAGAAAPSAAPSPSPTPTPTPSPTPPPLEAVTGERLPTSVDVGDGKLLGKDDRDGVDEAAVQAFATGVFDWLDAHLDDLQRGGAGRLDDVTAGGIGDVLDDAGRQALTVALASPDQPVASASYELTAYHDATIEFASVAVTVTDREGATHSSTLVFTPGAEGAPQLAIAGMEVSS